MKNSNFRDLEYMHIDSNFSQSQYKSKTTNNYHSMDSFRNGIHNPLGQDEYDDLGLGRDFDPYHSTLYHSQEYL